MFNIFVGIVAAAAAVLVAAWIVWIRFVARTEGWNSERKEWLFTRDADRITVRSADNVRALSDEQIAALEDVANDHGED